MIGLVNFSSQPGSVELREVPVPAIGDQDVLLEVKAASVCGSDLHQFLGCHSWTVNYPVVLGHEFSGVVARCGAAVKGFAEGDRVVSETAAVINPASAFSRQGLYNLDPTRRGFGYGVNGGMAKWVKVPERCLHRIPAGIGFEDAALTEPCCVAYNAVCVQSRLYPGSSVAVIGPGPIGLLCAMMAKLAGAGSITVIGLPQDRFRLDVARQLGVNHVLPLPEAEVVAWTKNFADGHGFDLVVDAAGVSAALKLALEIVRPAGQIVKVGWGPQPLGFSLDPLVAKAVTLQGSFSHNWVIWERTLALIGSGQLKFDRILNRVAPLADWRGVFEQMHHGQIVKGVLQPS